MDLNETLTEAITEETQNLFCVVYTSNPKIPRYLNEIPDLTDRRRFEHVEL